LRSHGGWQGEARRKLNSSLLRSKKRTIRMLVALVLTGALAVSGLSASHAAPSREELNAAKERLLELERDFELVVERYNLVNERLTQIQQKIALVSDEVSTIEKRMAAKEDAAVAVAVTLYKNGQAGALETVLSAETISEMESRLTYLNESEKAQAELFEGLAADRTELNGKIAELEDAQAKATAARTQLADLREEIEAKVADQEDEITRLNRAIERAEARERARERAAAQAAAAAAAATQQAPPAPPSDTSIPKVTATNANAQTAVDAALSQVGKPYQWGGAGPNSYDCSGLTMWAWAQAGVSLPHNSGQQYGVTTRVAQGDLQPGDLLFFGSPIHHVGMYVGGGRMVEAPYTGATVRVVSMSRSDYVGAGRPGI
jgi:peptidoglycan DL-endopeptidase CwlO